jgi:hypothetical protein
MSSWAMGIDRDGDDPGRPDQWTGGHQPERDSTRLGRGQLGPNRAATMPGSPNSAIAAAAASCAPPPS